MSKDKSDLPTESANDTGDEAMDSTVGEAPQGNNVVGWLAVLLSSLALAVVGYTVIQDWRNADDGVEAENLATIERLGEQFAQSNAAIALLETKIDQNQPQDFSGDIDALRRNLDEKLQLLESLPSRMSTLENSVASLAGISAGARETFLLAEAEYYLQIANAQLQLANNPQLASLALRMADERVTQISNPALIGVRRAISDELAALELMKKPDLVGATLTLASLAAMADTLPLASTSQDDTQATADDIEEQGGAQRAWQSVKDAVGGLVKITPPDQAKLALISPDAEYFLRNNIAMQLQAARLALLRGEQAIFEQALSDTDALLDTYFDANSAQVSGVRETIAEIRTTVFTEPAPDISESLRLLRQFVTLRETAG